MKMVYSLMIGSVVSATIAMIIAQIILSAQIAVLQAELESLNITSAAAFVIYSVIFIMFAIQFIITLAQARRADIEPLSRILIGSFLLTMVLMGLFGYFTILTKTKLLIGVDYKTRILKLFIYPVIVAILHADVQIVWIEYVATFFVVYNSANLYIMRG